MATIIPNYTARYILKYAALGRSHTMTFRYGRVFVPPTAEFINQVGAFISATSAHRVTGWNVLSASYAEADSNILLPADVPTPTAGTVNITDPGYAPMNFNYTGKSGGGSRLKLSIYGVIVNPLDANSAYDDWRVTPSEVPMVGTSLTALRGIEDLTAADGRTDIYWNNYANLSVSGYWIKEMRKG